MKPSQLLACALVVQALPSFARAQPAPPGAAAQAPAPGQAALEAQIARELGASPASGPAAPATPAVAPPAAAPGGGPNPLARLLLLPDISAIASFAGAYDSYDVAQRSPERGELYGRKGQPTFLFQELELGLQAVVDPYLRADAFISFTPEGVDVEEAYATSLGLPGGLQLRAGKLFSPFGRLNQQHPHTWEFVDAPLARGRLLAKETLSGPGVVGSWLAPLPWFAQLELAAQSTAPFDGMSPELTGVGRLLQYLELSEADSLGLGLSAARRNEGHPGAFRDLAGADLYYRHRVPSSRSFLSVQGELYLRKLRDVPAPGATDGAQLSQKPAHAFWGQAFYRQNPWIGYGARYEEAPAAGLSAPGTERRTSAVLDWYPSEFSRLALEVAHDRRPGGQAGFEALLHLEFILGAHGAHPF